MTHRDEFDDWPDPPEPDPETEQRDELEAVGYFDPEDSPTVSHAAARVTSCHWCPWEIETAADGSQPGTESLVPVLHVMLVHRREADDVMVEPVGSVLATIRATDLVTEAGWRKAAEGGTTNCECGHSFADHCVIDEHSDCPCGCSYKVAS